MSTWWLTCIILTLIVCDWRILILSVAATTSDRTVETVLVDLQDNNYYFNSSPSSPPS